MKSIFNLAIAFSIIALLFTTACEEECPNINFEPDVIDTSLIDTTYISINTVTSLAKKVLIEDFTGVRCPNCPNAAIKLTDISNANPGKIVGIAVHMYGTPFGFPHVAETDFRTNDGTAIFTMLNEGPLPIGGVDRILYSGETNVLVRIDVWNSYVDQRLALASPVNITLTSTPHKIEPNTFVINVELHYTTAVTEKNYITVALTESNIVSFQTLPNGTVDSLYVHNHILRDVFTNSAGNLLMEGPELNRVFIKEYKIKVDDKWNPDNCSVVAMIHESGSSFDVLQVEEIHLK